MSAARNPTTSQGGIAATPKKRKPSFLLHKAGNRGRVRPKGKDVYLDGEYGSQESLDLVCRERLLSQDAARCRLKVDDIAIRFAEHADRYYIKVGEPTSGPNYIRVALRLLAKRYGTTRAAEFGWDASKSCTTSYEDLIG